jgi:hypothetical protein
MLTLLGSILSWSEEERERAGLQRVNNHTSNDQKGVFWRGKSSELEKTDETEVSFALYFELGLTVEPH